MYRALPLDLAPCAALERLALTVHLAVPGVWARVPRMLQLHGAPLHAVTLVLRGPLDVLVDDAPVLAPVESALLALRRASDGAFAVDVVPLDPGTQLVAPMKMKEWFPRLLDCITLRY